MTSLRASSDARSLVIVHRFELPEPPEGVVWTREDYRLPEEGVLSLRYRPTKRVPRMEQVRSTAINGCSSLVLRVIVPSLGKTLRCSHNTTQLKRKRVFCFLIGDRRADVRGALHDDAGQARHRRGLRPGQARFRGVVLLLALRRHPSRDVYRHAHSGERDGAAHASRRRSEQLGEAGDDEAGRR
jgi:hypothetical protein